MINAAKSRIDTIVIFTDFSEAATNAIKYAAALAPQLQATILQIVYSEHIPSTMEIHLQNIRLAEHEHHRHLAQLENIKGELQRWLNNQIVVKTYIDQRPLESIVDDFNKDPSIGLLVMGLAEKTPFEQTLLGSNTIRVTKITSIPLLIIPEKATFNTIEKAVYASDLKRVTQSTPIATITKIVQKLGAKLAILNVGHNKDHSRKEDALAERNNLSQLWANIEVEYHYVDSEDIPKGITDFAETNNVQLVIAVPKDHGFLENLFHSSLTKKLVYRIHLPLLLLKEEKAS